jgi:hypothetical protein
MSNDVPENGGERERHGIIERISDASRVTRVERQRMKSRDA